MALFSLKMVGRRSPRLAKQNSKKDKQYQEEEEEEEATSDVDADASQDEEDHGSDKVIDEILSTQHPFEVAGICGSKGLSPVQKAITYVMKNNNGYATDDEILAFLRKHWSQIMLKSDRQSRQPPDKRILHINYSIQKEQRFLFVRSPDNPNKFGINNPEAPIETSRRINDQIISFQDRIIELLRISGDGMTQEEIIKSAQSFANVDGLYQNLPLKERVSKILNVKEALQEIKLDSVSNKWKIKYDNKKGKLRSSRLDGVLPTKLK